METQIGAQQPAPRGNADKDHLDWQKKLLPMMKGMIIFLTLFFFLASFGQLIYLQVAINRAPTININQPLSLLQTKEQLSLEERKSMVKLASVILLESNTMERRHHQANLLLMSSIWVRYLGFVTGMILALIGAVFILGKLENATATEISGKTPQGEASLKSASPGIILAVLGSTLMIVTIAMQQTVQVNDAAVYLEQGSEASAASDQQKKPVIILPKNMDSLPANKIEYQK